MKELFKKTWFLGTLILGLILIVFLMNLWIMSLKLTGPYETETFWSLAKDWSTSDYVSIFGFVFMIVFYVSFIPILLSIFSFFKKNHFGFVVALIYFLGFITALIVFQVVQQYLSVFALILIIFNIVFIVGIVVLLIMRSRLLYLDKDLEEDEKEIRLSESKIPFVVLLIDLVSILVFMTTFVIPLYTLGVGESTYHAIIVSVLLSGDTNIDVMVYFLVNFFIFLSLFLYFANCLSFYFFNKERFIQKSKSLITFAFVSTLIFFLMGLAMEVYYTLNEEIISTVAFIPLLLMCIVIFAYAILQGKYSYYMQIAIKEPKIKYAKVEPLLYVILLSAISVLMLLIPIIKINILSDDIEYIIKLTGFEILRDYPSLDPGYRMVAFVLVVMLLSVGLTLITTLTSYLAKYSRFNSMVKLAASTNVFFVFIIAISGYYFQIAKEINQMIVMDILEFYGVFLPGGLNFDYSIGTDAVYALIASVGVLSLMFFRKAFDREELTTIEAEFSPAGSSPITESKEDSSPIVDDESIGQFDPCPAFTYLDSRVDLFKQDLEKRQAFKVGETSLNELINFIVEYARNSRLHLSYTPEDIATFVAGLGASKLSILQGMSGTGKTSLPKIFSEAIYGNCEIIEVESSWKDKNELLGYYNEFSMKYTPKKFTLALYKAALNQEIFTFILLDEMNLSRIEYYFSDFLSLMENEEGQREIKLININLTRKENGEEEEYLKLDQGNTLKVPSNVWFIGTANRDESTFVISDKVYDRAHTMNFTKRAPKVRNYSNPILRQYYDHETIQKLFNTAKEQGNFDAESSEIIRSVEVLLAPFNISFGNRILNQIEDFVNIYKACFPNEDVESEAIEKILLSKVVAKLEVKTIDDKEKLEKDFEKLNLHQCVDFIKRLDNE